MRIGLVLDDTLDSPDGVQQYVLLVGRWLTAQGHDVFYLVGETVRTQPDHIYSLSKNWRVRFNGNVMSVPLPVPRQRLRQVLDELQLDVLHVQAPYSPLLAGRLVRQVSPTTAVVGTFHVLAYTRAAAFANRVLHVLTARSGKRFHVMMATSEPARQFAAAAYGYRSVVVPNPIDLALFSSVVPRSQHPAPRHPYPAASPLPSAAPDIPADASHTSRYASPTSGTSGATADNWATRQDRGGAVRGQRIVFLGRLVPRKGALHLLRAVAYLVEHKLYSGTFSVLVGGKGPLLPELTDYVRAAKLEKYVTLAGFVEEAKKAEFLAQADVAVFPSTSGESFGISLLEACVCARGVVVAGDNPGYRSVLQGLPRAEQQLIDPTRTAEFAQLLTDWLAQPTRRREATAAQQEYVQQFDIERVGQKIMDVYNQALRLARPS